MALSALCFRSKASNGYDAAFMEACRAELVVTPAMLKRQEFWLIEEAENLLACAALGPTEVPNIAEVALFFVDPDQQRRGIGRRLFATLLKSARAQGFARLTLDADPAAVPFYTALGFKVTGEAPSGSIPGRTLPVMTLDIAP